MTPEQKAKVGRILGYICIAVGALDLIVAAIHAIRGETPVGWALPAAGLSALGIGVIMVALGRRKATPSP